MDPCCGHQVLNRVHDFMGRNGYTEVFADQLEGNICQIVRMKSRSHRCIVGFVRSATVEGPPPTGTVSIDLSGVVEHVAFAGHMVDTQFIDESGEQRYASIFKQVGNTGCFPLQDTIHGSGGPF